MKFLRLAALTLLCSSYSFAVNKDLVALQRSLEMKMDAMQASFDKQIGALTESMRTIQTDTRHNAELIASMQESLSGAVTRSLAPVTGLTTRVEGMSEDTKALRDALADLASRLERMDAKMTDLKNQLQIMQSPPPAPSATGTGVPGQPGASNIPPMGMSAEKTYTDARRDQQTGNLDLAAQEYQQYLTYFPNTELAASAQYYLGEISYNRNDFKAAADAFDAVLERYPNNPKTADAKYMKGMALARDGQRTKAIQELRSLIQTNPNSEQARKATQALNDKRLFPSAGSTAGRHARD
ncbi:MAG: tetratricopeptide repeat protein [Bryobacteraceae bacterium]